MVALGAIGAPALVKWWQKRQAAQLSAQAEAFMLHGHWDKAVPLLNQAYRKNPDDPVILRLAARTLDQTPGAIDRSSFFWRKLLNTPAATLDDRVAYGTSLLRAGLREEAEKAFAAIPEPDRQKRPALELKAGLLQSAGHADEADALLHAIYRADTANPDSRLKLAALDLGSSFMEVQESAVRSLRELAQGDGPSAVKAMMLLATQTRLSAAQAGNLRNLLERARDVTDEQRFTILTGILNALPQEREHILDAETSRQDGQSFESSAPFLRWLANNQEYDRLLALLPPKDAVRTGDLFLSYATAMERNHRWKELREIIKNNSVLPLPPATISILLARCSRGLKDPPEVIRGILSDGIKQAGLAKDRGGIMSIANAAEELNQPETALEALEVLTTQPQLKLAVLERMIRIQQSQRNLAAMTELAGRCLAERPDHPAYIQAWCYFKLLSGSDMEKAADLIRRHAADNPTPEDSLALVLALADFRLGDIAAATRDSASINPARLTAGRRAVLAGLFHACGRTADAFRIAEKIPASILLEPEARFLASAL